MKLLGNRVLVLREAVQEQTQTGIYIPQTALKKRQVGKVVLLGDTASKSLAGKSIIFDPNCGTSMDYKGVEHLLMFESDIWAVN